MPTNKEQAELEDLATSAEFNRALARISKIAAEPDKQQATATRSPEPKPPAKIVQLPLWPEAAPAAPNPVLRSALFPAIQGKARRFLDNVTIASLNGVEIKFTGKQLNQEDLEVWLQVLNLARNHPLGEICHTTAHGLLKSLDRPTGNSQHKQLHDSMRRLQAHGLEVKDGRFTYFGSLIMDGVKDETTRHYVIRINPRLIGLFGQGWTQLDTPIRRKLRGKPLALWLQAHYATHAYPMPYSVEFLCNLSGSQTKDLKAFRQNLRQALVVLQATGSIAGWEIDSGDLVHVHKVPTITQRRKNQKPPKP
jgi:TrfA protein